MDGKKAKKQSLKPHLGFLKRIGDVATGARSDTKSILENIEDKNYWITLDNKKGKTSEEY